MTGNGIRDLRQCLGLTPAQLASLLGVHLITVYRWEGMHGAPLRIEPLQAQILAGLQQRCHALPRAEQSTFGEALAAGLKLGGTLLGLGLLANALFPPATKPRSKRTRRR